MNGGGVRLGVVMLCHTDLAIAAGMARIWAGGGAAVVIHLDEKAGPGGLRRMQEALTDLPDIRFSTRHNCEWGQFSLVQATQDAATLMLSEFPDVSHVFLASGSCLPLRDPRDLAAYLARHPGLDFIESVTAADVGWTVGGLDTERLTLFFPFAWRRQRWLFDRGTDLQRALRLRRRVPAGLYPHLGSQWWCLTAPTLRAILDDPRRAEFDRFFRRSWIPDESYFQTLVRRHSWRIESRSLTLAKFDAQGKPYQLYDDHRAMLEESDCFVARKIWPGAEALFQHFPRPPQPGLSAPEPQPARIERVIDRATVQRRLGRPGLYMQSRFPRKDAENGKTARPYAVFHGFSDVFPEFESWLAGRLPGDVHGHLFGPDGVKFAGRGKIGPGAIPASKALRDHDPKGFLTSLIRIRPQMQIFQFSPRDNQDLNWFIATDPNAHLAVITGAWVMPLLHSDMPFDDVRRMAAAMQWAEKRHLEVLKSVWVKARVTLCDLAEFLGRPTGFTASALHQIDAEAADLTDGLPGMRDLDGLPGFLRKLRNAGLKVELAGDFTASDPFAFHERGRNG